MPERTQITADYDKAYAAAKASFDWLGGVGEDGATVSDLAVGPPAYEGEPPERATGSRNVTDFSTTSQPRVNYTGATTRNRGVNDQEQTKMRIAACREAYENAGIIANAIDLMVDFSLEGLSLVHENKTAQTFMWNWAKDVKLGEIASYILKSYFVDGNVPVLTFRGRITSGEVRRLRKAIAGNMTQTEAAKFFTPTDLQKRRIIPYKYAVLDALKFHMEGADLLGNEAYEYELSLEDKRRLSDPGEQTSDALRQLREALGDEEFERVTQSGRLRIDPNRIDMIQYKRDAWRQWATPFIWRVIDDLKFKKLLRDMDISVAESVINTLTFICIGDTVGGYPPTPEMFQQLGKLLKTKSKSQTIIWNDLLKVIAEYPPVHEILGKEKYEQVDGDIRSSLGISEVILNGAGKGNFANSFLSIKTLIERLESARNKLMDWLNKQMEIVAKAMDFRKPATVRLNHMSLSDQEAEKKLLLELADRGMISYKNIIERFGEDFDIEVQRMKEEDQFRRKNEMKFPYVLVKTGKFGPMMTDGPKPFFSLLDSETLDTRQTDDAELKRKQNEMAVDQAELNMKQQKDNPPQPKATPSQQGGQGDKGGRPSDTKKPQQKKTTPRNKPQGQKTAASVREKDYDTGLEIFDTLYKAICNSIVKSKDLSDARSITPAQRRAVLDMIATIIGEFDSVKDVTESNVNFLLHASRNQKTNSANLDSAPPKIDPKAKQVYDVLISKVEDKLTLEEVRQITASAFAASRT